MAHLLWISTNDLPESFIGQPIDQLEVAQLPKRVWRAFERNISQEFDCVRYVYQFRFNSMLPTENRRRGNSDYLGSFPLKQSQIDQLFP